jgi:hypothetical protein
VWLRPVIRRNAIFNEYPHPTAYIERDSNSDSRQKACWQGSGSTKTVPTHSVEWLVESF